MDRVIYIADCGVGQTILPLASQFQQDEYAWTMKSICTIDQGMPWSNAMAYGVAHDLVPWVETDLRLLTHHSGVTLSDLELWVQYGDCFIQALEVADLFDKPTQMDSDSRVQKVREAEEAEHEKELAQSKSTVVLTPFDLFKKYVISGKPGKFVMDASAPRIKWVAYTTLHLAFRPYAPKIGFKGPGCLSKLMAEWYKDELADGRLVCKKFRRAGDREGLKVAHFSFKQVPRS